MTEFVRETSITTDAGLGRRLQLSHAAQWLQAAEDPYARLSLGFDDDPYPLLRRLRSRGPLWRSETGAWVTASYGPAAELLRHPDLAMPRIGDLPARQSSPLPNAGGGEIERICRLARPTLAAAADRHRDRIRSACDRLLDCIDGGFDIVADVAERLPVDVLADLLGGREPQPRAALAAACADAAPALDSVLCPQQLTVARRMVDAVDSLSALVASARATQVNGDGAPGLLASAAGVESAADAEALGVLLAVAWVRVTASLIANAVAALAAHPDGWHPDRWRQAAVNPGWARQVIDETLRYDPPIALHALVARTDVQAAGQRIPAGSQVVVAIAAANRDPGAFADPDAFDPGRSAAPGREPLVAPLLRDLAGPLARATAEIAVTALTARFPRLLPVGPAVRHRRAPVTRRLAWLPVVPG